MGHFYLSIFFSVFDSLPKIYRMRIYFFSLSLNSLTSTSRNCIYSYDGHILDPLASLQFTTGTYYMLAANIKQLAKDLCGGRCVFFLEGGYNLDSLSYSVADSFRAFLGEPSLAPEFDNPSILYEEPSTKIKQAVQRVKFLHSLWRLQLLYFFLYLSLAKMWILRFAFLLVARLEMSHYGCIWYSNQTICISIYCSHTQNLGTLWLTFLLNWKKYSIIHFNPSALCFCYWASKTEVWA